MSAPRFKRILVIDDSEVLLTRIQRALTAAGHEVLVTTQVVGNARHLPTCQLVIVDYHMPGLNGSDVVSSLRAVVGSHASACPIFLYTSDEARAREYKELGFDGVFTEKGNEQALVRQVASLFRLYAMRAAQTGTLGKRD